MGKVILYLAVSLDGYLADEKGGVDWLTGEEEAYLGDYGYELFLSGIGAVVMGMTTYRLIETELSPNEWPYPEQESYVITHQQIEDLGHVTFIREDLREFITRLRANEEKDIWICGGANLAQQLVDLDLIDEYRLNVMPILLGDGIRLFEKLKKSVFLHLQGVKQENGVVELHYNKK